MEFETFAPLTALPFIAHAFTLRTAADTRSGEFSNRLLRRFGFHSAATAEQTHGNGVVEATGPGGHPGVDALITRQPGLPLHIRCADCAAVFIVDQRMPAIALIHSGKKGTQLNIVGHTLAAMHRHFGTQATDCRAVISPSIGPCHYEVDLWAGIEQQLHGAGVTDFHNPRVCTACHLDRYFSYRAEKGQTGRMLAQLILKR